MVLKAALRSRETIGLVDGHCFYVSCHRLFTPSLEGRPVVVLSSNDSAVVSRSDEAKLLGVRMSQPKHELLDLQRHQGLVLLSSNFPLYADMHRRLITAITEVVPEAEIYSCDEAFVRLSGMLDDPQVIGRRIQEHVRRSVGIPCGVGISRNRTTAKLANWASKKWKRQTGSVVALMEEERLRKLLAIADVSEVWGVGSKLTQYLNDMGITTAQQLADADLRSLRRIGGVVLERTARELNWEYCLGYGETASPKQSLSCTRTFPTPVRDFETLAGAVSTYAANLGRKLRRDRLSCAAMKVFLVPARGGTLTPSAFYAIIDKLRASNDTRDLISMAMEGLRQCLDGGRGNERGWIRAGLVIFQTQHEQFHTPDLFAPPARPGSAEVMRVVDLINRRSGQGAIRFGRESRTLADNQRRGYPSPRFTTAWSDLPEVY